ncbi:MAG: hypothetical protein ACXABI_12195 [Candidatus Hodarchaeales archaeon]
MSKNIRIYKKRLQITQKKWLTIQGQSLKTVNMILSIISRFNLFQRSDVFSKELLSSFDDVKGRLSFHLNESLNKLILDLNVHINQFQQVIKDMCEIEKQFRNEILTLAKKRASQGNSTLRNELEIIDQAENTIQVIINMYETELALRKQIICEIRDSFHPQPQKITAYMVLWASEIYIETDRILELIEEFSHVEKIYEKIYPEEINSLSK